MNINNCFPEIFCVRQDDDSYKVYENIIYRSFQTLEMPANVLTPVVNVTDITLFLSQTPHQKIKTTFVRKWNSKWCKSCRWKYSGPYLKTLLGTIIPVVELNIEDVDVLPFNNASFYSSKIHMSDVNVINLVSKAPYTETEPVIL